MIRWLFDLDNTLVKTSGSNYKNSTPIPKAIAKVRAYKERGDHIIIMTARGASSKTDWRDFTAKQLEYFGIPYDQLIVGLKPGGVDYFVDDMLASDINLLKGELDFLLIQYLFDSIDLKVINKSKFCDNDSLAA